MIQWLKYIVLLLVLPLMVSCDKFWNHRIELRHVNAEKMTLLVEQGYALLDARDSNWYNGWPANGRLVGGHIPKARNFDVAWLEQKPELLKELLATKGITPDRGVVVYGKDKQDAQVLGQWLVAEMGFAKKKVLIFEEGFSQWLAKGNQPEKLPGYQRLVTPYWLDAHIRAMPELKVLDVSWGDGLRYQTGHIPGALHLDTGSIESEPLWNIRDAQWLERELLNLGIQSSTPVVVYGDDMMAAARALFVLKYAGVGDVRLLNGGWKAWVESGYPIERKINQPVAVQSFGAEIPAVADILADTEGVAKLQHEEHKALISVRSLAEYKGETSGYNYIDKAGRIPGALWGHSGSDPYHMEAYINPDNTLREYHDMESYWQELGIEADDELTFYCGTGWRASLAWFAASLMNYKNIAVYDGGWMEWSRDPSRPIDKG
ncbi:sulfurtransferase [Endozoicomonas sp. OPT23]|uniref:rhodanese-like domain-containing protein n=1 Tax=Endozoicomonas sp. OPT23 TaxID=2072845 RepID=UPI00129B7BA7|nr:rhodanese-like domain-containing protein [Endozoicomonas sp. OPT23]MRI34472.1 sulfurtransferase [Endozoicomonas sp. OPT23]